MKTIILGLLVLLPVHASAFVITVDSVDYDVTEVVGTYAALESMLAVQVWYDDNLLAYALADELEGGLGYPNNVPGTDFSPLFAVGTGNPATWSAWGAILGNGSPGSIGGALTATVFTFAVAQPVPEPATATLLMLGLVGLAGARRARGRT